MMLSIISDLKRITALLDARLAADPVRCTVLGTIRLSLAPPWCWSAVTPTGAMAVRSDRGYPVHVDGSWTPDELDALAHELARLPELRGIGGPVKVVNDVVERLPMPPGRRMQQRLFRLDQMHPPHGVLGHARRAVESDRAMVRSWYAAFAAEAGATDSGVDRNRVIDRALTAGECWLWQDPSGAPVSLAARRPVIAGSARIGPVFTPAQHRARGYGSAVTAAATADVLDDGAVPVLFTDLANPTSNPDFARV